MVKIRLQRWGKKQQVAYRIVVACSRSPRDGKFIDLLGYYNPCNMVPFHLNENAYQEWIRKGAQPTEGFLKLISKQKLK